jgi:ubiquinone/menaquinone biosynthesis C-methylase UbiE
MSAPDPFDAKARTWDADDTKHERAQRVAEAIRAAAPGLSGMSVLEYGCGTGLLGLALQPHAARVTLADTSREMLAVAEEKILAGGFANTGTARLDLSESPLADARFDLVCSLMTLHHIADTDGILAAFHAILSPGGVLCVSDLDAEDGSFHGPGFTGHRGFDRGELGRRLERAGFREVRFSTVFEVRKETGAGPRLYPAFLAVAARP